MLPQHARLQYPAQQALKVFLYFFKDSEWINVFPLEELVYSSHISKNWFQKHKVSTVPLIKVHVLKKADSVGFL